MRKPDSHHGPQAESGEIESETAPAPAASAPPSRLFERILEAQPAGPRWPRGEPFVVECIDARHPTLQGRVRIRWEVGADEAHELWVPALRGQAIRQGDRLLVQIPHGASEPIVLGVLDGFLPRPEPERTTAASLEVKRDEVLRVCTQEGQALVEIVHDEKGPVVRLLQADTRLDLQGKLSISAAELELRAAKGQVRIEASDDVSLVGEVIHLN